MLSIKKIHLNVASSTAVINLSQYPISNEMSPTNDKDAETNKRFPFSNELKQNTVKLKKKARKYEI